MSPLHYRNVFIVLIMVGCAIASPMFYKKNENDKYEPGEHLLYFPHPNSIKWRVNWVRDTCN